MTSVPALHKRIPTQDVNLLARHDRQLAVGSSANNTAGSSAARAPKAKRCFSPPDSLRGAMFNHVLLKSAHFIASLRGARREWTSRRFKPYSMFAARLPETNRGCW